MDNTKKHRFNIIDVFVILVVLALIGATVFFVLRERNELKAQIKERNITYTVCLYGVDKSFLSVFEEEELVFNSSTLNYIGTVAKIRTEKATVYTDKAVGSINGTNFIVVQKQYDDVYDVYITLRAKTTLDSRGVAYVDRERITIGSPLYLRFGNYTHDAYITNFSIS